MKLKKEAKASRGIYFLHELPFGKPSIHMIKPEVILHQLN